jgi:M6 family metalloprotease-like protein
MRTLGRTGGLLDGRRVSEGDITGLTVLVHFSDVTSTIGVPHVEALLNGQGYNANGNYCSVNEYFRIVSDGKLNYTNNVVGPVTLSHDRAYYTTTSLVEEALDAAVNDLGVDLGQFDSRNEGIADAVNFMYAGRTVYDGELWPHNWTKELTYNGVRSHYYMLTSLGRSPVDLSIGTFCHESGHLLCRFPDLYDYGKRDGDFEKSHGMGRYCLMGSGNHLDRGRTPSMVCGYLRDLGGWPRTEVLLNAGGEFNALHAGQSRVLKYETDSPNEYFIVENRGGQGLDAHLPDAGLAVYHCDTLGSNEWQGGTSEQHYQCGVLQADGHLDLENNVNDGDDGDLFGESPVVALSDETAPS